MSIAIPYDDLNRLPELPLPVFVSPGLEDTVIVHAERFVHAHGFFKKMLGSGPDIGLLLLDEQGWARHAAIPIFGLTHYHRPKRMVIAPGLPATFLQPSLDLIATHVPEAVATLRAVYGTTHSTIDLMPHINTWLVHDLGHACHLMHDRWFPRRWLMEYAADLCLYSYLAAEEPAQLTALMALPDAVRALPAQLFPVRTWPGFDAGYGGEVGLENYLWFHGWLFGAAAQTYRDQGVAGLRALWDTFVYAETTEWPDEGSLLRELERMQPALARVVGGWTEQ